MTSGISSYDNKNPKTFDAITTTPYIAKSPVVATSMPQKDTVTIANKKKQNNPNNHLNTAFLVSSVIASVALIGSFIIRPIKAAAKSKKSMQEIQDSNLPEIAKNKILEEYDKIKGSLLGMEGSMSYIKFIQSMPWKKEQNGVVDIKKAREILDRNHYGMSDVKDKIITHFDVENYDRKHNVKNRKPLILCLDGPPGVGKTALGEAIADAKGVPCEKISLAGVSQESFIRGTEQVYKGASPGQIIKAIQKSGVSNPVIILDEFDKMGHSIEHGDPVAALLDVIEPQQCKTFTDKYMELPYDLSNVTFVITSNDISKMRKEVLDRLEVIKLPKYERNEKLEICKMNIAKMMEDAKIADSQVDFKPDGIDEIVNQTFDDGARNTIRNLTAVFNKIKQISEHSEKGENLVINKAFVKDVLGDLKIDSSKNTNDSADKSVSLKDVLSLLLNSKQ